eukprot:1132053-Alexandrium_andersonii.AAC.1
MSASLVGSEMCIRDSARARASARASSSSRASTRRSRRTFGSLWPSGVPPAKLVGERALRLRGSEESPR